MHIENSENKGSWARDSTVSAAAVAAAPSPYHCKSHGGTPECADSWRVFCVVMLVFRFLRKKSHIPSHYGDFVFRITEGRCKAQAVICRSVTARSRLRSQTHLCWVFGDESGIATRLSSSSSVLPCLCLCADAQCSLTLWRQNYFFLISAHRVYKIWIIQEPKKLALWNKLHFEEKKTESIEHV